MTTDRKRRRHVLTLTDAQADLLVAALDLYARIGIGQLETLLEYPGVRLSPSGRADARYHVAALKHELFDLPISASDSYGIYSQEAVLPAKNAYDLRSVVRHRLAWDRAGNPTERDWRTMITVDYDEPRQAGSEELATIQSEDVL